MAYSRLLNRSMIMLKVELPCDYLVSATFSVSDLSPFQDDEPIGSRSSLLQARENDAMEGATNEAFERAANFGLSPNMITYLLDEYHLDMPTGTNIILLWSAATSFTPIVGACLADSFFGRFPMIGFGCIFSILGTLLLWLTAVVPQARPPLCDQSANMCNSSTTLQIVVLCSAFALLSIGAGGIRSSSIAFGADQLNNLNNLIKEGLFEKYLSWYYSAYMFAILIAMTCIVYIQENFGWVVGFGVPLVLMFLSAISFFLASPLYVKLKANTSLFTGFIQVIVASYKKRHLAISLETTSMLYYHEKESVQFAPSNSLRFFNKACIIVDAQQDLTPFGKALNPWNLCTVDQVEYLKTLIKVIPLWSTGIIMSISTSQSSFPVLQAYTMDRHLTPNFEIPAASFGIFTVVSIMLWIVIYHRIVLPLASKIMERPAHLNSKHRMGISIIFSFLAMAIGAIVELIRRKMAISEGYINDPKAVIKMSALWLAPQNCLIGLAEAFNVVGQNEFFMSELPKSMSSVSSNFSILGMSVASLLMSLIVNVVDGISKRGGSESWVSRNINKGHYDYFCCVLAGLSLMNCFYFLACSRAYGPCKGDRVMSFDSKEGGSCET